ncbi:curli production assembly/transport component CsgG [Rhabdobacter roseus]|uniref:Curli production assembly/transport component CsgG n=1 Tax=Rhabdobacter roseus TaxID=1655419 RepID=A0A840TRC3_9BACT|nr:CsgG/HfaB family protein [Rhabdobacter roseus]MBB5282538.1 curli production assembly/transport component CsgG [Rhabdobacter roseus]
MHQPTRWQKARLGEETNLTSELRKLPLPKEKLAAAVYKFRDQTGQYKPSETGANWSTAITQGTTNILLKALEESGWFMAIERENVSNLLNERKIIRSSMAQYKNENDNLPPLLFAGVILEGGVVSYDANVITGGAGLRYFGAGGSTQYRQDRVTVYLRAVATKSGKILKTVYTSKTVLSQAVDVGLFRFVKFKRLLEAETGYTTNEPAQLAVTEAIEKAVQSLIIEGIRDGLWDADTKYQRETQALLAAYETELNEARETDVFGGRNSISRPSFTLQPYGSLVRYEGDYGPSINKAGYGLAVGYALRPAWIAMLNAGVGTLAIRSGGYQQPINYGEFDLRFRTLPYQKASPFLQAGAGIVARSDTPMQFSGQKLPYVNAAAGLEYSLTNRVGLHLIGQYNYMLNDDLDEVVRGGFNDSFWRASVGLTFHLGKSNPRFTR